MTVLSNVWVIIPAYNEESALANVLRELMDYPYHVLVVDDGSTDCTMQEALQFPITVLHHATNLGQGAAIQTGISYALSKPEARYIVTFDADGQHRASEISLMIKALQTGSYDIVLGTRFAGGGQAVNISRMRSWAIQLALWFTRLTTGLKLTDTHNGFRAMTRQSASRLKITQNGMAHASEILSQIVLFKLRYIEIPVTVQYTAYSVLKGQSISNGINILWDLLTGKLR